MFERYTERARRTIFHARNEALSRGACRIEPKDIVLGLTHDAHQPGCPFAKLHDNATELRSLIAPETSPEDPLEKGGIPLSVASKKALAYAAQEADRDRSSVIGSDHLLRGVLRTEDETADKLVSAGYTLSAMREASKEACPSARLEVAHIWWWHRLSRRRLVLGTAFIVAVLILIYLRSQN